MRLFSAIFPTKEAIDKIVEVQNAVRSQVRERASWTKPERMHLTLGFYGECDANQMVASVARAALETPPMHITLERVGAFPNLCRARVCILLPTTNPTLTALANRLDVHDKKSVVPHLTLARFRESVRVTTVQFQSISFDVSEVVLVESILGAHQHYRTVERFPLENLK